MLTTGVLGVSQLNSAYFPPGESLPRAFHIGAATINVTEDGAAPTGVPEPASLALFSGGIATIYLLRRRR